MVRGFSGEDCSMMSGQVSLGGVPASTTKEFPVVSQFELASRNRE